MDRRFVYIDPKPGMKSVRLTGAGENEDAEPPGFLATLFGALSDIPREQPIRDNLDGIERMSARIRRLRRIIGDHSPGGGGGDRACGRLQLLSLQPDARPGSASWRAKAHTLSAREAGYAYAAYGQLKLATVVEEIAAAIFRLGGGGDSASRAVVRDAVWSHARAIGLTDADAVTAKGARRGCRPVPRAISTSPSVPAACASSPGG